MTNRSVTLQHFACSAIPRQRLFQPSFLISSFVALDNEFQSAGAKQRILRGGS